ncbi:MAG: Fe2+/Zn2+ uptake regulation protein [Herbinix sp.]|nr:Fe2+/Zn2+ uptake regulation protein [Herbinix sp.]
MRQKASYITKQGEAILGYIASLEGTHVTVEQIASYFEQIDGGVGLTTIYRHLDKLVQSGKVRKYIIDGVSSACYQYVKETNPEQFHLKCDICGSLQHLKCDTLTGLTGHILEEHNFQINATKTVFYGRCKNCLNI